VANSWAINAFKSFLPLNLNTLSAEWKKIFFIIYKLTPKFVTNCHLTPILLYSITEMKRLSELAIGKRAKIISFEKDELFIKLMEMGCIPGEIIKVDQIAPLGDPISISVAGYNLSLRLNEANSIFVEEEINH